MTSDEVRAYFAKIGAKGGRAKGPTKARKLTKAQARRMAKARAAKRANERGEA